MAATGWTSPTGVWLPVVGAEIRSDKVFVVLRRQQHQATVGGGCCKPGLGRCGGEFLWVYGRRGGVSRPARRCRETGSGTTVGPG